MAQSFDLAVVGGGILGLATARAWLLAHPGRSLVLFEKGARVAAHQTGHNSGVLHSGLYYTPGTEKAANCRRGKAALEAYCQERGIACERVGKLVVATDKSELERLAALEARGRAHGVELHRLEGAAICDVEPLASGVAALHLPETAIVDYIAVAEAFAEDVRALGGELRLAAHVTQLTTQEGGVAISQRGTEDVFATAALVCCGLQADRMARAAGLEPNRPTPNRPALRTVPFLGQYFDLAPELASQVRGLIYPVPDPRFPFLGVHLTRRLPSGGRPARVDAGPNAALAFAREGYGPPRFNLRDTASALTWPGTWRLLAKSRSLATSEVWRSLSRRAFAKEAARLVPSLTASDLTPAMPGIRAQALGPRGQLVDDYVFAREGPMLHVLNAPSPAATSSLAIAEKLLEVLRSPAAS